MVTLNADLVARIGSAVFFPRPDAGYAPEAPGARDHLFDIEDGVRSRLRLFLAKPDAPVILFFHGNGETAMDYDPISPAFLDLPASFVVAEYRGYGPCSGKPDLGTFLSDAHKSLDELKSLLAQEGYGGPVLVMGRSLGSAPAIELAHSRSADLSGLIIESGFARIVPLLELIGLPARQLGVTEEHGPGNQAKMGQVGMPTLIMHAEHDEIIPIRDAVLLHEACQDPDRVFIRVPKAGHNDIQYQAGPSYFEHVGDLLKRI